MSNVTILLTFDLNVALLFLNVAKPFSEFSVTVLYRDPIIYGIFLHAQHCITYTPTLKNQGFTFKHAMLPIAVSFTCLPLHGLSLLLSVTCKTLQQTLTMQACCLSKIDALSSGIKDSTAAVHGPFFF